MVAVESNPGDWVSLGTAVIYRFNVCPTSLGRLRSVFCGTPIVFKESVAHLATRRDRKNGVVDSMLSIICYRIGTGARASAADLRVPRQYGDSAEIFAERTGKNERHGGAVAETSRETEVLIDAQIV